MTANSPSDPKGGLEASPGCRLDEHHGMPGVEMTLPSPSSVAWVALAALHRRSGVGSASSLCRRGMEQHKGSGLTQAPPAAGGKAGIKCAFPGHHTVQTVLFGEESPASPAQ